jgi:hypothetical protein
MALIGGRLFKIVPMTNTAKVTEVAPLIDPNSPHDLVRTYTDGSIDPIPLNQLNSHSVPFRPEDAGQRLDSSVYPGGSTIITSVVNSGVVITRDNASGPGANIVFSVHEAHAYYRNRIDLPIAYMVQADKFLIAQDGESLPIIYDGNKARRADSNNTDRTKTEVPVGTIMAYGMGRICIIVNQRDVAFGDLFGSHNLPDPADSLPFFTERNFLTGGFDAAIPFQQGLATGMVFFPQLDTSTGNGQLLVFAERGAAAFFLSLPRELWQTSAFQILALLTTGLRGHRSISVVNEDLWFRAEDGYRSYRQARSEPSGWAHIPLSTSVKQFLDTDDDWLLKYASSMYFDNRIIGTCSPAWNQGRPFHNGMVAVDFDILSSFGVNSRPAWDGHWAKVPVSQLVTGRFNGVTRTFIFGLEATNQLLPNGDYQVVYSNQLYELTTRDKQDFDGPVDWELVSRLFDFSKLSQMSTPFTESEIYDGDIWLSQIAE